MKAGKLLLTLAAVGLLGVGSFSLGVRARRYLINVSSNHSAIGSSAAESHPRPDRAVDGAALGA